ncbi:MAG: hypothetical protein OXC03_07405 [Flavobacteriaceae bacterium]|nr:hypothetical protein [Flavobacteriaceae bacterium]
MKIDKSSKKSTAAIYGTIISIVCTIINKTTGIDLNTDEIILLIVPIASYIFGQGVADIGKEKMKNENKIKAENDEIKKEVKTVISGLNKMIGE